MGHGRSEGLRVAIDDVDDLVHDALLHVEKMQKMFPNIPTFLVGHSMVIKVKTHIRQFKIIIIIIIIITDINPMTLNIMRNNYKI